MLSKLTRKLCPFISLAIASLGCGKQISEGNSNVIKSQQNQSLPSTYNLELAGSVSTHSIPENGVFSIPSKLIVVEGNGISKKVVITYNMDPTDAQEFEFKCSYQNSTVANEIPLNFCYDNFGANLGDISRHSFMLDYGKIIKMNLTSGDPTNLKVEASLKVDWK